MSKILCADDEYKSFLQSILDDGIESNDRTGVGTLSLFGPQIQFDLSKRFPLLTTKKIPFGLIKSELLWFLRGDTNIKYLLEHNNHIWDEWGFKSWVLNDDESFVTNIVAKAFKTATLKHDLNLRFKDPEYADAYDFFIDLYRKQIITDDNFAKKYGDLGPVYGKQWRNFNGIDQIENIISELKTNPNSRRLIVSAWNPNDVNKMALPPCHTMFQLYVRNGKLSSKLYQRSGDSFLGIPFNIASYALLTHILAKQANLEVGKFILTIGDAHIYNNHIDQVLELISRKSLESPTLNDFPLKNINDYEPSDFTLSNYKSHPPIKADVAI